MSHWWFNGEYAGGEVERTFASLEAIFALQGEQITRAPLSHVIRVTVAGRRFYVKRYVGNGKSAWRRWFGLRGWLGPQRVRSEWRNLRAFRAWGIPTPSVVAYGIEQRLGCFVRGALVTEELRETTDLSSMTRSNDPRLSDRRWVAEIARQVAAATRSMHAAGFVHNDLKWRNLLVDRSDPPRVYFIDCPNGRRWWGAFRDYRIVKDLACLDKVAKYQLSRTQRLRFYLDYVQQPRLTAADKKRIARIVGFFAGRE